MPDDIRMKRIEAFFQKELSRIVSRDLKDPIFQGKLISFTEIRVARDLSTTQVNVSVLTSENDTTFVVQALNRAEALIRAEIREISDLRRIPVFTFREDHTIEYASRIDSILDTLDIPPEEPDESNDENAEQEEEDEIPEGK